MLRSRSLIVAAATAALAVGVLGAPAAAANPRLAFVNGIPGKTVDVCIGSTKVRSNLKYGKWFERTVGVGDRVVRFRNAAPGNCTGSQIALELLTLVADDDLTLVGTAKPDKIVVFDNTPVPVGATWQRIIRHAADVGPVVMTIETDIVTAPAALPATWNKGAESKLTGATSSQFYITATKVDSIEPLAGPKHALIVEGRRGEVILVGSKPRNARFVLFSRPTLAP